jgi:hypothetical protein
MSRREHDHEFYGECDIDTDYENVYVNERCQHAPILNSWTDDARDETYYETGPRCETVRRTRYEEASVEFDGETYDDPTNIPAKLEDDLMAIHDDGVVEEALMNSQTYGDDPWPASFTVEYGSVTVNYIKAQQYTES